jgi:biopolymer transport protein ExbB
MKSSSLVLLSLFLGATLGLRGAESFDAAMQRATLQYAERLQQAGEELARVRRAVTAEKAPLYAELRATENKIIQLESELRRLETAHEDKSQEQRKHLQELDAVRKNARYLQTLAHENLKAWTENLAPGEEQIWSDRLEQLQQKLDQAAAGTETSASLAVIGLQLEYTAKTIGGYAVQGNAMSATTNQVALGTFAFVGPEIFFAPANGENAGSVRSRPGVIYPVSYPLADWPKEKSAAFFRGEMGAVMADASGGKALRLQETQGSIWEHVRTGGVVGYAIVGVGVLALILILQKLRDVGVMSVDSPTKVQQVLTVVASGSRSEALSAVRSLRRTTQEVFTTGLQHLDDTKDVLEERLQAVLLRQRLFFERRLPLLAVIATAAPLMGLLGTVVGMVKTFSLITVFGTGNAGKLSSGISEVLVATELGLIVAIPALVAHGFLSHRIQKNLSLLERYALEFVTASRMAKNRVGASEAEEPVTA